MQQAPRLQGCCTAYSCGVAYLAMLHVLMCHCGQCWSRFSLIIWAGMQMSGCGHLLIVFYKHMPVVQARRHYILTAALWLAVLLDIQRQTVNIVLLVFVVVLFLRCDSLLRWLKNWWPNSLPCSSNVNILLINDIKALICLNNHLEEKKVITTKALFESGLCCVYIQMWRKKRKKGNQGHCCCFWIYMYVHTLTHTVITAIIYTNIFCLFCSCKSKLLVLWWYGHTSNNAKMSTNMEANNQTRSSVWKIVSHLFWGLPRLAAGCPL